MLIGIKEIDVLILSYIEDTYFIYKLSKINLYLKSLYEDNNLWKIKIEQLCPDLKLVDKINNMKTLYFDVKGFIQDNLPSDYKYYHDDRSSRFMRFLEYTIKHNYLNIMDWIIEHHDYVMDFSIIQESITKACEYGNVHVIEYIIEKYGILEDDLKRNQIKRMKDLHLFYSEESLDLDWSDITQRYDTVQEFHSQESLDWQDIISKYKIGTQHVVSYLLKNNKCIETDYEINSNNIEILKYFEEYGIVRNMNNNKVKRIYPSEDFIKECFEKGIYEVVEWCESRHLIDIIK